MHAVAMQNITSVVSNQCTHRLCYHSMLLISVTQAASCKVLSLSSCTVTYSVVECLDYTPIMQALSWLLCITTTSQHTSWHSHCLSRLSANRVARPHYYRSKPLQQRLWRCFSSSTNLVPSFYRDTSKIYDGCILAIMNAVHVCSPLKN